MRKRSFYKAALSVLAPVIAACHGLTDVPDPSSILNPGVVNTQSGAVGLYNTATSGFRQVYAGMYTTGGTPFTYVAGLASDEFVTNTQPWYSLRRVEALGAGNSTQPYSDMHTVRMHIDQAVGALKAYGVTTPSSYIAQLQTMRGYLYVMFAEMYCSGVPFSRAVYGGDIVLGQPQTTTQMLEAAIVNFDSALAITTDSTTVLQLATVGKARALLNLDRAAEAAALVTPSRVPSSFSYNMLYTAATYPNYVFAGRNGNGFMMAPLEVANRLGTNGLNYLEAGTNSINTGDPRVFWYMSTGTLQAVPYPGKFTNGSSPIPVANGIEARLIEAEALLQAKDYIGWAGVLNTLRANNTPVIPALTSDSTTGAPNDAFRENVMFRERAFWLYGTGHRLGDMRRLVRQYHRTFNTVFPIGLQPKLVAPNNVFSNNPYLEPPKSEIDANPNYNGCLSHDA